MTHRPLWTLMVLLVLTVFVFGVQKAEAATSTPTVKRIFYLSTSGQLVDSAPSGSPESANITRNRIEFGFPQPVLSPSQVTVSGQLTFSLWINSTAQTRLNLNATFTERLFNGSNNSLSIPFSPDVGTVPTLYKLNGTISPRTLLLGSRIFVSVSSRPQSSANVTLLYGSSNYSSLVVLPLSGYVTLSSNDPVKILDTQSHPADRFDLNATFKAIYFQANVVPAFGPNDLLRIRVNLTVVDPNLRGVVGAANFTMLPIGSQSGPPYTYFAQWVYPSNSTPATYQVWVDISDGNQVAYSFRGPSTFVLFRGLFLPPPLDLIPYFGAGGAAAVGAVLYYRRRKGRSYLAPFDYFNNLTGGEIEGGTVVTIEGNTGSGKTLLAEQLMFEDLKKGRSCVFVATADFPSNIRTSMKSVGLDITGYENSGLLAFVDGYSSEAGQESQEKFSIPSLADLTTLGIKITSSLPSGSFKDGSLYFDSLTPLASRAKPESIVSLVQSVGARVKGMSGKAFFTVGPSVDTGVHRQLEEFSDCVVQMEAFEEGGLRKSRLKIAKFRARRYQQGWALYTIEDGRGIIFYSKKPRK